MVFVSVLWFFFLFTLIILSACGPDDDWVNSISSEIPDYVIHSGIYIGRTQSSHGKCNLYECPTKLIPWDILPSTVPSRQHDHMLHRTHSIDNLPSMECDEICHVVESRLRSHEKMVVILTTCNHIAMTLEALQTLRDNSDHFDMIIVDDYSIDGTTDILIKQASPPPSPPRICTHDYSPPKQYRKSDYSITCIYGMLVGLLRGPEGSWGGPDRLLEQSLPVRHVLCVMIIYEMIITYDMVWYDWI